MTALTKGLAHNEMSPGIDRLSGHFRITGRVAFFDGQGKPKIRFRLSNYAGDEVGIADPKRVQILDQLTFLSIVYIEAWRSRCDGSGSGEFNIQLINPASKSEWNKSIALSTLPRRLCDDEVLFDNLIALVNRINDKRMRHFVRIVIEQHGVMKTLFTIPASRRYHNSERVGLCGIH